MSICSSDHLISCFFYSPWKAYLKPSLEIERHRLHQNSCDRSKGPLWVHKIRPAISSVCRAQRNLVHDPPHSNCFCAVSDCYSERGNLDYLALIAAIKLCVWPKLDVILKLVWTNYECCCKLLNLRIDVLIDLIHWLFSAKARAHKGHGQFVTVSGKNCEDIHTL